MKKEHAVLGGLMAAALLGTSAWAGAKVTYNVGVDTSYREAYGSVGTARNSADATQSIGCQVYSYSSGSATMFCSARNASGTYGSCSSSNPTLVDAARAVKGDSYIYFSWDTAGACTYVLVSNHSIYEPKQP